MKTIKLYGELGRKFGKIFRFDVKTPREAVRALSNQIKGFERYMMTAHEKGIGFAVFTDKSNIDEKQLDMNTDCAEIRIVPRVIGAKKGGLFQVILGVVMVAAAVVTGGMSLAAYSAMQVALMGAGIGLVVGGLSQMLMPKVDVSNQNEDGNKANKGFGGAATTVAQGNPVPVLRGRREIGGFIISAGQDVVDVLVSNPEKTAVIGDAKAMARNAMATQRMWNYHLTGRFL